MERTPGKGAASAKIAKKYPFTSIVLRANIGLWIGIRLSNG